MKKTASERQLNSERLFSIDRRFSSDRRQFSYAAYVPERRSGMDRRNIQATQSNTKLVYG